MPITTERFLAVIEEAINGYEQHHQMIREIKQYLAEKDLDRDQLVMLIEAEFSLHRPLPPYYAGKEHSHFKHVKHQNEWRKRYMARKRGRDMAEANAFAGIPQGKADFAKAAYLLEVKEREERYAAARKAEGPRPAPIPRVTGEPGPKVIPLDSIRQPDDHEAKLEANPAELASPDAMDPEEELSPDDLFPST